MIQLTLQRVARRVARACTRWPFMICTTMYGLGVLGYAATRSAWGQPQGYWAGLGLGSVFGLSAHLMLYSWMPAIVGVYRVTQIYGLVAVSPARRRAFCKPRLVRYGVIWSTCLLVVIVAGWIPINPAHTGLVQIRKTSVTMAYVALIPCFGAVGCLALIGLSEFGSKNAAVRET